MVNIESSQLRRPRPNMSLVKKGRTCCFCKKLFCCVRCCELHEKRKHSNRQPNCPLCASQKLSLRVLEDKLLLCHIVTNHLPLYCCLCGEIFKRSIDLESFGTCKWWKSRHRRSLVSDKKSVLGTPYVTSEGKESSINIEYNGNFHSLTSPPELYRNTSTPMIVGQKNSFDFKTPSVPNFSLKTSKINSASLESQTRSDFQDNSKSNYVSFPSSATPKESPYCSLSSSQKNQNNSGKLDIAKEQKEMDSNECRVEDMELTNVEGEILLDSPCLETCVRTEIRSDSLKKVRFSDQYETPPGLGAISAFNATENEEYFQACDTLLGMKDSLENSRMKIYEQNAKNTEKENSSPNGSNVNVGQQSSGSSRVVMMVVVENNSTLSTSDIIDSGLRKLERIASEGHISTNSRSSPGCSSSITTVDSYRTVSCRDCYSTSGQIIHSARRDSSSSSNSNESNGSSGLFSAFTNAVRTVIKNLSGGDVSTNVEREQISRGEDIPRPSNLETFNPMSSLVSSLLQRPGKRPRDTVESSPTPQRQMDFVVPQVELRSPLAKRPRGWYRIKAREPIARMRNSRHTSPRGVSSETQVFHQGSLSVGSTVLPLPSRAHQSTQTE
ncbi:uncharacterized protein LOC143151344 isoform X2 [Ptiloglossa arizonensis]|uniref:uncharacterized protein LOC143151344 isoform X2 n=1 Tax=Ptiloglossa arizonensis TaxID=3350558 RepID=UPI003F9FE16B